MFNGVCAKGRLKRGCIWHIYREKLVFNPITVSNN